ncbi:hypothetical protein WI402_24420 (plasmid) [Salmonella enterica subsp. enterica serovar Typhimurium]|uniref:hypothetical protein n=1 Tax=Salmonella enterica TaxID=28901 RepID=UPI0030D4FCA7
MTTITGKPGSEDSTGRLMYHLHNTARLLIPSVVADNASSVRYAHDVLCLWFNQKPVYTLLGGRVPLAQFLPDSGLSVPEGDRTAVEYVTQGQQV